MKNHQRYARQFKIIAVCSAVGIMVFGAFVLLGWALNSPVMKGVLIAGIGVKTNTAIGFFLSGLSLFLLCQDNRLSKRSLLRFLGFGIFLIGACTLIEHIFGWNLGIDELFFTEVQGEIATTSPNRMGPPASVNFMMIGISILLLNSTSQSAWNVATQLMIGVGAISVLPILGYLFEAHQLYGVAQFTGIALLSAVAFLILSVAFVCSSSESQIVVFLTSEDAGGVLARRLLPPALLLPPFLGYLRTKGEAFGLYDAPFGRSLLIVAFMLIFARLVWWSARLLQARDRERTDLVESERAARGYAERANRFKDEFLATVSHELRTPLNAILGWSQLLQRNATITPELSKGLETIERNSRLQAQLIEDLLDMSRTLSGKLRLNTRRIEIASILEVAIEAIEPEANAKQIRIERNFDAPNSSVNGDSDRIQQVFWNILSNAIKFTPMGGSITITLRVVNDFVEVVIADTGEGIDQEFLTQIFDRFTQADSSTTRKYSGMGIGLSIVRELVTLHGGSVTASSQGVGHGTTFLISFPYVERSSMSKEEDAPYSENNHTVDTFDITLSHVKVLVVDDDSDARDLTARILRQRGAEIFLASSADDALEQLRVGQPHVIVSDIGMPGKDGYQLIRTIRGLSLKQGRNLPAIALTAFIREEDRGKALKSGYQAHLHKPVDASELVTTIHGLVPPGTKEAFATSVTM